MNAPIEHQVKEKSEREPLGGGRRRLPRLENWERGSERRPALSNSPAAVGLALLCFASLGFNFRNNANLPLDQLSFRNNRISHTRNGCHAKNKKEFIILQVRQYTNLMLHISHL